MSTVFKVGYFTSPVATGSQSVSGVGFTPKALIVFGYGQDNVNDPAPEDTFLAHDTSVYGMTDGTLQFCSSTYSFDGGAGAGSRQRRIQSKLVSVIGDAAALQMEGSLTSFDADGFTINWTTVVAHSTRFFYVAFGGDGLSAKVNNPSITAGTGDKAFTGIGFKPDVLFLGTTVYFGSTMPQTGNGETDMSAGFSDGTTSRFAAYRRVTASSTGFQRAGILGYDPSGAIETLATVKTFDSDGYTLTFTNNGSSGYTPFYLALKGVKAKVGFDTQKTSTGTKATTGIGFQPSLLMFLGNPITGSTIRTFWGGMLFGAYDGSTQVAYQSSMAGGDGAAAKKRYSLDTAILESLSGGTVLSEAAVSSLDGDGFTLNWTTADATAREFQYLALTSSTTSTPTGVERTDRIRSRRTSW